MNPTISDKNVDLASYLNEKAEFYNKKEFVTHDPIQIPKRFSKKEDIEIIAFLCATISWGNRKSIITNCEKLVEIMQPSPHLFILNYTERKLNFVHRTFNSEDLNCFFLALNKIYRKFNSLENAFYLLENEQGIKQRIVNFRTEFCSPPFLPRSEKHIANPIKGSSAKRINMFLRWMVRDDERNVDFGIWKSISMSELHIPLDVHTSSVARKLGLIQRKQDDWKALEELQQHLISFDPKDPAKYDFALFGIGVFENKNKEM